MAARVITATVFERSTLLVLARLENPEGQLITQASVTSINREVWSLNPDNRESGPTAENKANVILDTPVNDDKWPFASPDVGYNFIAKVDKDQLSSNGSWRIVYEIILPGSPTERSWVVAEPTAKKVQYTGP